MILASAMTAIPHQPGWWETLASWGDIGSAISGLAAAVLAVAAIIGGTAGLEDWRARQRAQRDAALEEAESIRLERRRSLKGWSPTGVSVYGVRLVTEPGEMARAGEELTARAGSAYVILRLAEGGSDMNRANDLRQLIGHEGLIARAPGAGEYEALEKGSQAIADEAAAQAG